jgi:hypothetical protein
MCLGSSNMCLITMKHILDEQMGIRRERRSRRSLWSYPQLGPLDDLRSSGKEKG